MKGIELQKSVLTLVASGLVAAAVADDGYVELFALGRFPGHGRKD